MLGATPRWLDHLDHQHGEPRDLGFEPKPHWELGEALGMMDFAYSYITRSGRIDDARLRAMSPVFMARYEAARRPLQQSGSKR